MRLEGVEGTKVVYLATSGDSYDEADLTHIQTGEWGDSSYVVLGDSYTDLHNHETRLV